MKQEAPHPDLGCKLPPEGWYCSRKPHHEGPCAARATERTFSDAINKIDEMIITAGDTGHYLLLDSDCWCLLVILDALSDSLDIISTYNLHK